MLDQNSAPIRHGNLIIDSRSYTVTFKEKEINLVYKEFAVLYLLAQHPGWVFTKEKIYQYVYEEEVSTNIDNIIFCLIYSLRKKIEPDAKHPIFIHTVRGIGYKFMLPKE